MGGAARGPSSAETSGDSPTRDAPEGRSDPAEGSDAESRSSGRAVCEVRRCDCSRSGLARRSDAGASPRRGEAMDPPRCPDGPAGRSGRRPAPSDVAVSGDAGPRVVSSPPREGSLPRAARWCPVATRSPASLVAKFRAVLARGSAELGAGCPVVGGTCGPCASFRCVRGVLSSRSGGWGACSRGGSPARLTLRSLVGGGYPAGSDRPPASPAGSGVNGWSVSGAKVGGISGRTVGESPRVRSTSRVR